MTIEQLPVAGAASPDLARRVHEWWTEAAAKAGLDLSGFRPDSPFAERASWAAGIGLVLAAILSRFSTKMQHSTEAQVKRCVEWAAGTACIRRQSWSALMSQFPTGKPTVKA